MAGDGIDQRFGELARTGSRRLRNELVVDNQGLAIAFARRYRDRGVPSEDLEQVAMEALVRAVDRFDPSRGIRFSTFAARTIEGDLKQYFRDRTWDVHVPRGAKELASTVQAAIGTLTQRLGRVPTPADLAAELGVDVADVTLALDASSAYRSERLDALERPVAADSATPDFERVDARVVAPTLLARLPDDEREIVELRFFAELTQSQIAERVGVSQMQISRVLRRALDRLRRESEPL